MHPNRVRRRIKAAASLERERGRGIEETLILTDIEGGYRRIKKGKE